MKIGKYIFEILPLDSFNHDLSGLPYINHIYYDCNSDYLYQINHRKKAFVRLFRKYSKSCKHIKPNTGIRYKIIGFYCGILIIKQLN